MIKILEIANFNVDTSPVDRNRRIISSYINKEKFDITSISGKEKIDAQKKLFFNKFDVIHTRSWPICIPLSFLVKIRNVKNKHLYSVHGLDDNKYAYMSGKILSKIANKVHCISKFTASQVKKEYDVDSCVIYNGLETDIFKPLPHTNEKPEIMFVGSYVERKKPQYILQLAKQFPNCNFTMYGSHFESNLFKSLKEASSTVNNLSVNKTIPFHDLVKKYQKSDIFIFPSVHEGFGNVLLEANSCGIPVITFDVANFKEIITHGENGLLSDVRFIRGNETDLSALNFSKIDLDLKSMKENLQYLIEDEQARVKMGMNARQIAKKFDWNIITRQYEELYTNMVEKE